MKKGVVLLGFILSLIVECFFSSYGFIGLIIVGFIVGYLAHEGILGGLWNAAVAGALGSIICGILFIILITTGLTVYRGIFGGLAGFTISGLMSLVYIAIEIIFYALTMGIAGAVGGAISKKRE